jgi:TolB-like protein/Flp pilus assembly protein TadD
LGEEAILSDRDELRLNPRVVRVDVIEFETALAAGDPAGAIKVYSGPFLDGFFVSDAPELERWVERERARLAGAHAKALETLAEAAETERDFPKAVEWWKLRAAHDPYDSGVALRLMHALDAAGSPAAALQHAAIHERLLQHEFEVDVPAEVRAAVESLRRRRHAPEETTLTAPAAPDPVRPEDQPAPAADAGSGTHGTRRRRIRQAAFGLATAAVIALAWPLLTGRSAPADGRGTAGARLSPPAALPADGLRPQRTIAVLPFVNLSPDPEEEYFSDGLTDELIGTLSQVGALRVVARTSAFAFKGEEQDVRTIARMLGVGTVLEGSVRREGDRVRVSAQLIDAATGLHVWADTYEREGADMLEIQSDLALRIAAALEAELTPAERARLAHRPTASPEAHAFYLKGRYFWNQRTGSGFARAIEYFERAIEADSQYAAAYALLANTYTLQALAGVMTPQESRERVLGAALKAIALDDGLAEAHAALGTYLHTMAWDSEGAEREFRRAIALDPNYPSVRHSYGILLAAMGRLDEAVEQKRKAVELDPLAQQPSNSLGYTLLAAGRFEEARAAFGNALELDSAKWRAHAGLGAFYAATGQLEESVRAYARAVALAGAETYPRAYLARALALSGRKDEARQLLAELRAEATRSGIHDPTVAIVFLSLDDTDAALEWLERSYRQRHPQLRFMGGNTSPGFEALDGDPRYQDLLRRVGLPG